MTLVDISQVELDRAISLSKKAKVQLHSTVCADAARIRDCSTVFRPGGYDAILCQGPLYHLPQKSDRHYVLEACKDMLRPGGLLFAAFITKYAHLRDVAIREPTRLMAQQSLYEAYLDSGVYNRNPSLVSYHVDVAAISKLFPRGSGLKLQRSIACEGFLGGGLAAEINKLDNEDFECWVDLVYRSAQDPALLGNADHVLAVAKRCFSH